MDDERNNRRYLDLLGKEYEKAKGKKDKKSFFKLKNVTEIADWRKVRPKLNKDFVEISYIGKDISAENLPSLNQERQLVTDLFQAYLGGNGCFIQADPLQHKNDVRTFTLNKQLDMSLHDLAKKCLIVATYYSQVSRFVEDNRLLSVGRVNQALATALDITLIEYKAFVVKMETVHLKNPLSLQEYWFHIQDIILTFEVLNEITHDISKNEFRGGATLTYLNEQATSPLNTVTSNHLLKHLTKQAAVPYMQSVKEWIFNGKIFDPFDEFMIMEKPRVSFKDCLSLEYWEKRYQLRKNYIPSFLSPVSGEIFKSGAYLNVIRESARSNDNKLRLAPIEDLKYSLNSAKYVDVIRRAYTHSSSYLLRHLLHEYQILSRFSFMKKYFLLQQGDFITQVLDTCDDELSKLIADVIPSRLQTLVDMAVRGVEDSIRHDFNIALQPQDLWTQVSKIISVATITEQEQKNVALNNSRLTGYESFALSVNCQWPISLVFSARIISYYQMLFRLLFYCKHIERLLFRIWIIEKRLRELSPQQMKQYSMAFALRYKMVYFIQNMQYYMMQETIEPNWIDFQQQLQEIVQACENNTPGKPEGKVYSIDDLQNVHKKFLDKCIADCLLSNGELFPIFMALLSICKEFVSFIIYHEEDLDYVIISNNKYFFQTVLEMDTRFQNQYKLLLKSIAEFAPSDIGSSEILEILNRADFNFYFSSKLET